MRRNKGARAARAKARRYELLGHLGAEARALKKGLTADREAREACAAASEEVDFRTRYRDRKTGRFIACGKGETMRRARTGAATNPRRNALGIIGPSGSVGTHQRAEFKHPDPDVYLKEAARYALNFMYAVKDAGGGAQLALRKPVFGFSSLLDLLKDAIKRHDRHVSRVHGPGRNPSEPTIYPRLCAIVARKAAGHEGCDLQCERNGHLFKHKFTTKNPIIGLNDGSLMIPCGSRRLWGTA